MPALTPDQIGGIANVVLSGYDYGKYVESALDLTDYPIAQWVLGEKSKHRRMFRGKNISLTLHHAFEDSFRMVGWYDTDTINTGDNLVTGTMPFKDSNWHYAHDEHEVSVLTNENEIVDFVKVRASEAWQAAISNIEELMWTAATNPDSTAQIWSVPTWLQKPTNGQEGHLGGNPSGFTNGLVFNADTYTKTKNYVFDYAAISKADFILKLKTAMRKCAFKPQPRVANGGYATDARYWLATNLAVIQAMETLAENQNDQLGFDLDPAGGRVMFQRHEFQYIPYLDADTQNPVYGVDTAQCDVYMDPDWAPKSHALVRAPNQRNVMTKQWDMRWNLAFRNRRTSFCAAVVA